MVIGLLVVSAIPTTIGVCQALSAQKKADAAAKEKAKFHMTTTVSLDGKRPVECDVVLRGGRLWIDHPSYPMPGHKFTGYYFPYPSEEKPLGLVSTISDDPPMLNWIFVDKDNNLLRHGGRQETLGGHTVGPWYWTDDEERLTLEKDDSQFLAVLLPGVDKWTIAWDRDGRIKGSGEDEEEESSSETEEEGSSEEADGDEGSNEESRGGGERDKERKKMEKTKKTQTPKQSGGGGGGGSGGGLRWIPIRLERQMQLGMKSKYVKGEKGEGGDRKEG